MAMTLAAIIKGYIFAFNMGLGTGDGVAITPATNIQSPGFLDALQAALDMYPLLDAAAELENYASEYRDPDRLVRHLRGEVIDFLSEVKMWYEMAQQQTIIPITTDMERYAQACQQEIERRVSKSLKAQAAKVVKPGRAGYVYLIQSSTGAYKIGKTKNPQDRIRTFAIKLPFEVEYVCLIPTTDMAELETRLHQRFADKRVNGEWFNLSPEDVEYIKGLAT